MLVLDLGTDRLDRPWAADRTGWWSAAGRISPLRHPALEHLAVTTGRATLFGVRERCPDRPAGASGWLVGAPAPPVVVDDGRWAALLDELAGWPLRTVSVLVAPAAATVSSGANGIAPLYLVADGTRLRGDWDAGRLYQHLPGGLRPDPVLAGYFLATFDQPYSHRTIIDGLRLLTQGCSARWRAATGQLGFTYPPSQAPPAVADLRPDADVPGGVWRCLTSTVRRGPWSAVTGSELSSGLDSALVTAAVVAECRQPPVRSYAVRLSGPAGDRQQARRLELVRQFGTVDTPLSSMGLEPFVPGGIRDRGLAVLPWEDCYLEAFDELLALAAADGVEVMHTGFGGDELCYHRRVGDLSYRPPADDTVPDHLTPLALAALREIGPVAEPAPAAIPMHSALQAATISSARYLRRGIWPVFPLTSPDLVRLCARLPWSWRQNRAVTRTMLGRLGVSGSVANASDSDSFAPVLARGLRRAGPGRLSGLWRDSRLADLGLLDPVRFQAGFARWVASGAVDGTLPYYAAIQLELTLRSLDTAAAPPAPGRTVAAMAAMAG